MQKLFSELLIQDANNAGGIDHLKGKLGSANATFPIEDGAVSGRLLDESGKFNLNNLTTNEGKVNEAAKIGLSDCLCV